MIIEDISMTEFEQGLSKTRTILIPVGSVEEHGSHLPLSTDTIQAYEVAKSAASRIPLFVAPPLHYGNCRSTSCHPGTISISTNTIRSFIVDIVTSCHAIGLMNFIILSGHAGGAHKMALQDAGEDLLKKFPDINIAVVTEYDLAKNEGRSIIETLNDSHAGEIETSRIMYSHPHLVKGIGITEYPNFPNGILVRNKRKFWPGGVWGDPSKASADKGKLLHEILVEKIIELATDLDCWVE
jgi:creatinine amidohydrolase